MWYNVTNLNNSIRSHVSVEIKRNIVITGASGQLGRALVQEYLRSGARVIAIDITASDLIETTKDFKFIPVDIRSRKEVKEAFNTVRSRFGTIHTLVNNAGVAFFTHYSQRTDGELQDMFEVNLKGSLNCILEMASTVDSKTQDISIVNIASIYGVLSPDFRIYQEKDRRSPEMYGATKAGLIQLTKYFAVSLADFGIRVNSVSPGGIFNDLQPQNPNFVDEYSKRTPLGRMANVNEIVQPVLFLSSQKASYITGHNLIVDGGYSAL